MDVRTIMQFVNSIRCKLVIIVFAILILWPTFHMVIIKNSRISSWRFFGWGMYATPNPEAQARLRVVIMNKPLGDDVDQSELNAYLAKLALDPEQDSRCLNLFLEQSSRHLKRLPPSGFCRTKSLAKDFIYFMHFGSKKHLAILVRNALFRVDRSSSSALAFFTRQRFSVFRKRAYLESDVYEVLGDKVRYLGKIET